MKPTIFQDAYDIPDAAFYMATTTDGFWELATFVEMRALWRALYPSLYVDKVPS